MRGKAPNRKALILCFYCCLNGYSVAHNTRYFSKVDSEFSMLTSVLSQLLQRSSLRGCSHPSFCAVAFASSSSNLSLYIYLYIYINMYYFRQADSDVSDDKFGCFYFCNVFGVCMVDSNKKRKRLFASRSLKSTKSCQMYANTCARNFVHSR